MRICLINPLLTSFGGPGRALEGFAKGLRKFGHDITIVTVWISHENLRLLRNYGDVFYWYLRDKPLREDGRYVAIADLFFGYISRKLEKAFKAKKELLKKCDVALLMHDCGFDAMLKAKRNVFNTVAWFCQGIHHLYPLIKSARLYLNRIGLDLSLFAMPYLTKRLWVVSDFDIILSNSCWQAHLLSYLVGCDVHGVIYEPTDTEKFRPLENKNELGKYALSVGGKRDIKFPDIEAVARTIKVARCGDTIKNSINLGYVSDNKLAVLYSNAYFTLYPTLLEQFGYVCAESMSCDTPVLTYAWQGPGEIVVDGRTGWHAHTQEEFIEKAIELYENGYDPKMREYCRKHACEKFSIEVSTTRLLNLLKKYA